MTTIKIYKWPLQNRSFAIIMLSETFARFETSELYSEEIHQENLHFLKMLLLEKQIKITERKAPALQNGNLRVVS